MPERILTCPYCTAPLTPPSPFAKSVVCRHCNTTVLIDLTSVSAAAYRAAFEHWNAPKTHGYGSWCTVGNVKWAMGGKLASGSMSDVYVAERARWPTERAVLKVCRNPEDTGAFDRERQTLMALTEDPRAFEVGVPLPIAYGEIAEAPHRGHQAMVLRWAPGFVHTLQDAQKAFPRGIDPVIVPWIWRRVLEVLTFIHRAGWTHGAVRPEHVLVHGSEHGARLVGWSAARQGGDRALDIMASAKTMALVLGGSDDAPAASTPPLLADLVHAVASGKNKPDSWALREHVGEIARSAFGHASYHPLRLS
jgi:hypothetical protein